MANLMEQQQQHTQKPLVQPVEAQEAQKEQMPPSQQEVTETVQHQQQAPSESSTLKLPSIESTIIDIPSSSSSYDTDSSTASSTCCTRHGEHIYMERIPSSATSAQRHLHQHQHHHHHHQQQQQHQHGAASAADADVLHFKADRKKSWPIFIVVISIIEMAIFIYDSMSAQQHTKQQTQDLSFISIPTDSVFIYRPDRRLEVWRFISYMFLHANWFHLGFNVVVQLFYGIPLEVMHGSARVAIIYFAGVFAGSLGTSVVDSEVYLVGASGGVYALLAAHLANITLNYGQMKYAVAQLVSVVIFVSCDLGYAFYTQYLAVIELIKTPAAGGVGGGAAAAPPVSYIAHLTGALAGLTIGLLVLKNFERRAYENLIWWLALGIYSAFTVFAIVFNLINTMTAQMMEEQGEVITQHLLHDLGVS